MTVEQEQIEHLRDKIEALQDAVKMWSEAGFNRTTIVVLLHHRTKIAQRIIRDVLDGIRDLDVYLNPVEKDNG